MKKLAKVSTYKHVFDRTKDIIISSARMNSKLSEIIGDYLFDRDVALHLRQTVMYRDCT